MRSADDEFAGGVDQVLGVLGEHVLGQDFLDDLLDAEFLDLGVRYVGRMLGRNDHIDDAGGLAIDILDGHLGFCVRAQPLGELAGLADTGELAAEAMGVHDRRGHQLGRFIAGIAKHDALVAGTLLVGFLAIRLLGVHALGNIRRLGGEVVVDENPVGVEHVVVVGVADAGDRVANDLFDVDDRTDRLFADFRDGDFAADHHEVAFHKRLAGDSALGVHREASIEDGIRNGVCNLVRMAFTNGFGRKNIGAHVFFNFRIVKS